DRVDQTGVEQRPVVGERLGAAAGGDAAGEPRVAVADRRDPYARRPRRGLGVQDTDRSGTDQAQPDLAHAVAAFFAPHESRTTMDGRSRTWCLGSSGSASRRRSTSEASRPRWYLGGDTAVSGTSARSAMSS